jgi:hypothetical protein
MLIYFEEMIATARMHDDPDEYLRHKLWSFINHGKHIAQHHDDMSRKAAKSMSRLTPPRSHHDLIDDLLNGLERTGDEALELMRHSSIKERMFK